MEWVVSNGVGEGGKKAGKRVFRDVSGCGDCLKTVELGPIQQLASPKVRLSPCAFRAQQGHSFVKNTKSGLREQLPCSQISLGVF